MDNEFDGNGNRPKNLTSTHIQLPMTGLGAPNTFTHQQVFRPQPNPLPVTPPKPADTVVPSPVTIPAFTPNSSANQAVKVAGLLHPVIAIFLMVITLNIFWPFWLSSSYKRINALDPKATTITAGAAWSFLFIPFFGIYWFYRIIFNLPRTVARLSAAPGDSLGAGPVIASLMFLVGSFWIFAFALPSTWMILLGIAALEALILGFIGYCQQGLNRAQLKAAGATSSSGTGFLTTAGFFALICGLTLLIIHSSPPRDPLVQMQSAQQALADGDFEGAAKMLQKIDQPEAEFQLACLYNSGLGGQQDPVKAVFYMTKAANADLPQAETTLGLWYANGNGVEANPATAIDWYSKAVNKDPNAAVLLSLAYASGNGAEQNPTEAYKWMLVADKRGNELAAQKIKLFSDTLDDNQRAEAEAEADIEYKNEMGGAQ